MYKISSSIVSIKSISKVGTTLTPFRFQRFHFSLSALRSENPPVGHNGSGYANFRNNFGKSLQFNPLDDFQHSNGNSNGFHEKRADLYPNTDLSRSNMGRVEGSRIGGQFKHVNNFPNFGSNSNGYMNESHNQVTNLGREGPMIGNRNLRNGINEEISKISPNKDCNGSNKKKHSYYFECLSKLQESYNEAGDTPENKSGIPDFNPFQDVNEDLNFQDFYSGHTAGFSQNKAKRFDNLRSRGGEANGTYKENFDLSNKSVNGRKNSDNLQQNFNQTHNNKGRVDRSRIVEQSNPFEKSNLHCSTYKTGPGMVNYPNEFQRKIANNIANCLPSRGGDANGVNGKRVGLHNVYANSSRNSKGMQQNGNIFRGNNHHNMGSVERPRIGGPFNHFSPNMHSNSNPNDYHVNDRHNMQNREGFRIGGPMYPDPNINEYHGSDHHSMHNGEGFRIGGQSNQFNGPDMYPNPNINGYHGSNHHNMHNGEGFRIGGQSNHFDGPDMYPNSNHIGSVMGRYPNGFQRSNMINGVDNFQFWGGNADSVYRERFDLSREYSNDWMGYEIMPQTFNPYHQNMGNVDGSRIGGQFNHFDNFKYLEGGGFVKEPHCNAYYSGNMMNMRNYASQHQESNRLPNFRGGPFNDYQNLRGGGNGVYEGRYSPYSEYTRPNQQKLYDVNARGLYSSQQNAYEGNNQIPNFRGEGPLNGYQNCRGVGKEFYEGSFSPNSEYSGLNQQKLYDVNARGFYGLQQNSYQGNNQAPNFSGEGPSNGFQNLGGIGNVAYEGKFSPNSEYNGPNQQKPFDFNARGLYSMQQNEFQRYSQASNFRVADAFQREETRFTHDFNQMNDFQNVDYNQRMGSQYTYRDQHRNLSTRLQQNSSGYFHQFNADGCHRGKFNGHNSIANNAVSGNVFDN